MKKLLLALFTVLLFTSFTTTAKAADQYWGVKTGIMDLGYSNVDNIIPVGFVYGMHIQKQFYFEAELNIGVAGGEFKILGIDGDMDLFTLAGYGVFVNPLNDQWSFKGKVGLLWEDTEISISVPPFGKYSAGESGIGLSLGAGARLQLDEQKSLDFEYTILSSDVGYLSVGLNFAF